MQKREMKKNKQRNTTNEDNNPAIKREISRSGDNTYYRNNKKRIMPKSCTEYYSKRKEISFLNLFKYLHTITHAF